MVQKYVLDACALVAFVKMEVGFDVVREIIEKANTEQVAVYMNKINLFEVFYGIRRVEGLPKAEIVYNAICKLPINIIDNISDEVFLEASRVKSTYKMSLADSIALGEASTMDASLITSDHHEFDIIEKNENIKFKWVR